MSPFAILHFLNISSSWFPSINTYKSIWPISLHAHVHIYTCTHVGVAAQKQETFQKIKTTLNFKLHRTKKRTRAKPQTTLLVSPRSKIWHLAAQSSWRPCLLHWRALFLLSMHALAYFHRVSSPPSSSSGKQRKGLLHRLNVLVGQHTKKMPRDVFRKFEPQVISTEFRSWNWINWDINMRR